MTLTKTNSLGVQSNLDAGKDWMKEDLLYRMLNPQKCIVCTFDDQQGQIIDTVYGYAHKECMQDQEDETKDMEWRSNVSDDPRDDGWYPKNS